MKVKEWFCNNNFSIVNKTTKQHNIQQKQLIKQHSTTWLVNLCPKMKTFFWGFCLLRNTLKNSSSILEELWFAKAHHTSSRCRSLVGSFVPLFAHSETVLNCQGCCQYTLPTTSSRVRGERLKWSGTKWRQLSCWQRPENVDSKNALETRNTFTL